MTSTVLKRRVYAMIDELTRNCGIELISSIYFVFVFANIFPFYRGALYKDIFADGPLLRSASVITVLETLVIFYLNVLVTQLIEEPW